MNVLDLIFIYKVVSLQYCINGYLSIERHLALGTPRKGAGALSRAEIRAMSGNVRERSTLLYYTLLYCTGLRTLLYCALLRCVSLNSIVLYCTILYLTIR